MAADDIRILSYNLWQGRAQHELHALADSHQADVLCIQEARGAALPSHLGDMKLAVTTARNRLAVAIYVRAGRFEVDEARTFKLLTSRHDRLVGGTEHRLAASRVTDLMVGRQIVLGSLHATPFTDSNAVRRRQIDDAQRALAELGPGLPTVLAGDFNHPILLFMLRMHLKRQGMLLAHTASSTFHRDRHLMRGKFDVASSSQFVVGSADTLPQGASDHRPVLFVLGYEKPTS